MASLNQVNIIGNLGQDPKVVVGQSSGKKAVVVSVATTGKGFTRQDGTRVEDPVEWHNVVFFGKLAEVAEKYLHKGSSVFIQGRLHTHCYEGEDKVNRYSTEIIAGILQMLDKRTGAEDITASQNMQDDILI